MHGVAYGVYLLPEYIHFEFVLLQMIFPWMFDEIHALRKFKDVAHILAEKKDWGPLYDTTTLSNNKVHFSSIAVDLLELFLTIDFSNGDLNLPTVQDVKQHFLSVDFFEC